MLISYGANGYVSEVDAYTAANHNTQWVQYDYFTKTFAGVPYVLLQYATYISSTTPLPKATYAYQSSNLSAAGTPLILTCQDVRYPGPMKDIQYAFVRTLPLSYGQLSKELHLGGALVAQLTVSGSSRTETRGDGSNLVRGSGNPTRTFTYGATLGTTGITKNYLLKTTTDFKGNTTTLSYNANGFASSVTNANNHTTSYEYLNQGYPTGVISKVIHPGGVDTIQYFYTDATGAYLDHVIDERGKQTTYKRNSGTMTTYEIDYPDGGIETYTYNSFGQVLTHFMPSNTAANGASTDSEKYSYDSNGRLLTYTPPATGSDPSPSPHPTRYTYDVNDHHETITDPKNNVTTFGYNEIGQVTIVQHPGGQSTDGYVYNTDGTLQYKSIQLNTTPLYAYTYYYYDDYKRLTSVIDPVGREADLYYDTAGGRPRASLIPTRTSHVPSCWAQPTKPPRPEWH